MLSLEYFFKLLNTLPIDDYIVRLKLKYDHEDEYQITNELLLYDGSDYYWDSDWDEGQQDIQVIGYIPVSEVYTFYIPLFSNDKNSCRYCKHLICRDDKHETGFCEKLNISRKYDYPCIDNNDLPSFNKED